MWVNTSNRQMRKERARIFTACLLLTLVAVLAHSARGADRKAEEKKEPQRKCCEIGVSAHEGRATLLSICFSSAETVIHLQWKDGRACATPGDLHLYDQNGRQSPIKRTTGLPHCQPGKHPPQFDLIRFQWVFAPVAPGTTSVDLMEEGTENMEGYRNFEFRGIDVTKCARQK
jgi:hypothetical protein